MWEYVRISGTVCNIFFIATYIPHKGRTQKPRVKDTITQLQQLLLLQTIPKSDYIMLAGDFNCQIPRNIPECTGRWSMTMTKRINGNGYGQELFNLMHRNDLFTTGTSMFKSRGETVE